MPARLRAGTKGRAVLFLDHQGWSAFDQVACAIRRAGFRAIKLTDRRHKKISARDLRWWANRMFYDERLAFDDRRDVARVELLLDQSQVADVIVAEPSLTAIGVRSALARKLSWHSLAFRGTPAAILLDKFEVNRRLAAIGVAVPRQVAVTDTTLGAIIAQFGLPMVVKARTGAAGADVRIAETQADIALALEDLQGRLFYQEYIAGEKVSYNAVVGPKGPMIEHGFVSCAAQYPMGPSAFVKRDDDAALLKAGRDAAKLFGCQGFVSFGFIRTRDKRLFHLDPNIRPWGSLLAPIVEGIDFAAAYTALLNCQPWPPPAPELAVLPGVLVQARTVPAFLAGLAMLWRIHASRLAFRYAALMSARAVLMGLGRLARRIRGRWHPVRANPLLETKERTAIPSGKGKSPA